jgi:hypothetical protein
MPIKKDKDLIVIDPKEMTVLAEEAGKFIFKPRAEKQILKLHETILMLQDLEEKIKETIGEMGKALNPNFKGVKGDRVSCIYRKYGAKYEYDWKQKSACLPFLKEKIYYSVDGEKVDRYLKEVKELPQGIVERPREEKLSITYGDIDGVAGDVE